MKYRIKVKKHPVINKFKVYFDIDTGRIHSITNKTLEDHSTFFEVPVHEVEDFLTGTRNMTKHKVVFDVKEQQYKIASDQESLIVYVDDHIFRINQIIAPQVIVTQNNKDNVWQISASKDIKDKMKDVGARLEEAMMFSITQKNNPNILYNHFYVRMRDIIEKEKVEFNFASQIEANFNNVSVYTNRKFEKYSHEVVNE